MGFVLEQGRIIPKEDRLFGINQRAKKAIAEKGSDNVIDGTLGVLMNDNKELIVLSSVEKVFKSLSKNEFAAYAPIGGIPEYKEAVKMSAFGSYKPKRSISVCATPGGTGTIHDAIANYSKAGQTVLISDWFWATYNSIATEIGRTTTKFELFKDGKFNASDFKNKVNEILKTQDEVIAIINTPAQNPTGYAMTDADWNEVANVANNVEKDKNVIIFIDTAYIDFAGDEEEFRSFVKIADNMASHVLVLIGYSFSKTLTLYGLRVGALICMAPNDEIAEEFRRAAEFSSRAAWSNSPRAGQTIVSKIYQDPELKKKVDEERKEIRDMLLSRGRAFEKAAKEVGLEMLPFTSGFFCSIPCKNPDAVSAELEKEDIFLVPLAKGVRVSVAALSEETCKILPKKILEAKNRVDK